MIGFEDRVLPLSLPVAAAWGRQQYTQPIPVIDALIAATARVYGMAVVTRNVKDFERSRGSTPAASSGPPCGPGRRELRPRRHH